MGAQAPPGLRFPATSADKRLWGPSVMRAEAIVGSRAGSDAVQAPQDMLRRIARGRSARVVVILHLSRLRAPAPRPHHHRIARAILNEAAQRHGGQLFTMANADIVLLCEPSFLGTSAGRHSPAEMLAALFRPDAGEGDALVDCVLLPEDSAVVDAYVAARLADPALRPAVRLGARTPLSIAESISPGVDVTDMISRRLVVRIDQGRGGLRPDGERVGIGIEALIRRHPSCAAAQDDPFLRQHLRGFLGSALMQSLRRDLTARDGLHRGPGEASGLPWQIDLGAAGVLSDGFEPFAEECLAQRPRSQIVLGLREFCADPEHFLAACARIRAARMGVLLHVGPVSSLPLIQPRALAAGAIAPDAIALDWDNRLATAAPSDRAVIEAALRLLPLDRVILSATDSEAAMLWGAVRNMPRFEGRHVDLLLATRKLEKRRQDDGRARLLAQAPAELNAAMPAAFAHAALRTGRAAEAVGAAA